MIKSFFRLTNNQRRLNFLLPAMLLLLLAALTATPDVQSQDEGEAENAFALYMPFVSRAPVNISSATFYRGAKVGGNHEVQLVWAPENATPGTVYTINRSHSPSMNPVEQTYTSETASINVQLIPSTNNVHYFTVQSDSENAEPSEVIRIVGPYRDDFSTNSGWDIRRQDFDDTQNVMSYVDGKLKMHVQGRWDYFVTSPLAPAPEPPYRISTLVKFDGPGNLNTYGIIFGGDYLGGACPTIFPPVDALSTERVGTEKEIDVIPDGVRAPDSPFNVVDNCLNHYYRTMFLWKDGFTHMHGLVKQIDYHDEKNSGRGEPLSPVLELPVSSGSANDWNEWAIEVYPDGIIKILSGEDVVYTKQTDKRLIYEPYFGLWASTDEYPGSDPLWDYIVVEPITAAEQQ